MINIRILLLDLHLFAIRQIIQVLAISCLHQLPLKNHMGVLIDTSHKLAIHRIKINISFFHGNKDLPICQLPGRLQYFRCTRILAIIGHFNISPSVLHQSQFHVLIQIFRYVVAFAALVRVYYIVSIPHAHVVFRVFNFCAGNGWTQCGG